MKKGKKGNFTLPGETGFESLTLELAERWGADIIRDSDGTKLSDEILNAGYGIYSTICPVREHNEWIRAHETSSQQSFLCTLPKTAESKTLSIRLLDGFFEEQFQVNDTKESMKYWQVYDRTNNTEVDKTKWNYNNGTGEINIQSTPWHQYTVSFLAWRVWEEISMYNHTTNNWGDKEHLMQLNPYDPEAQEYLKGWLKQWCAENPQTTVVRFTSLFYNFVWIWGSDKRNRNLFVDWASYDFTVCPAALDDFEREYGYALYAEDFVRQGKYNATHRVPNKKKLDWMEFIGRFVRKAARELIDIVHEAGKLAYVFYDDNWLGLEPYNGHFEEFNFDGLIKCVFSGYEVRLCADVPVKTHEIRFHPYLFPVGLGGLPTFSPGGKPGKDAFNYWVSTRRALLRKKIERCGLGGYLSLTRDYPDFVEAMDTILEEFRIIGELHDKGAPLMLKPRIAVLHAWGKLRSWTLSGHFHETDRHTLIHVLESLSGLPFDVEFISFDDIKNSVPENIDVIINAGEAGDAWSGGICWEDDKVVDALTKWVHNGGVFFGINEPSALEGYHTFLRMAHVLGVDIDNGERACHGRWEFEAAVKKDNIPVRKDVFLTSGKTQVIAAANKKQYPLITANDFGKGKGLYCSGFTNSSGAERLLLNLIIFATSGDMNPEGISDNSFVECAVYPASGKLAFVNNSSERHIASCMFGGKRYNAELEPYKMQIIDL